MISTGPLGISPNGSLLACSASFTGALCWFIAFAEDEPDAKAIARAHTPPSKARFRRPRDGVRMSDAFSIFNFMPRLHRWRELARIVPNSSFRSHNDGKKTSVYGLPKTQP